jgi:hypothetical protein
MKPYIVFRKSSGVIVRSGYGDEGLFPLLCNVDEDILMDEIGDRTHVVDGIPIRVEPPPPTTEQLAEKEETEHRNLVLAKTSDFMLDFENRLLALEKKPPVTKDEFKEQVKTK